MKAGKAWGATRAIEINGFAEMHHASIVAGKCCSRHAHAAKWNGFYVLSGRIRVRVWQPNGLVDATELGPGDYTRVAPGLEHRFEGLENAEIVELYWPSALNPLDISRADRGGDMPAHDAKGDSRL